MNKYFSENGYIDDQAIIEKNVTIMPSVFIYGKCVIKKGCIIYPNSFLYNSKIGENCIIKSSYIEDSIVYKNVNIGPYSHIRPGAIICDNCKIGNFVEIKNSILKKNTKVSHLAYVGDAVIGENCNIGCGVIFVNYNGKIKQKTIVGDNCFIGSNCNIIAPIEIATKSYICAGTTLTKNTQKNDFVIGRVKETIKSNRAEKYLKEV